MRVVWTKSADGNLQAIHDYIAQTSIDYARRMVQKITNHSRQIAQFPLAGRTVPEFEIPQLREVIERPYRINLSHSSRTYRHHSCGAYVEGLIRRR